MNLQFMGVYSHSFAGMFNASMDDSVLVFIFAGLVLFLNSVFTVQQQSVAIVERFGKFVRLASPGLNFKIPFIDSIAGRSIMRVQQLDVEVETKTEDNVFLTALVSVQYRVLPDSVYEAYYKLDNPRKQITSYVFDVVRARVPKLKLDDLFERKDEIANVVREELDEIMAQFGYSIVKALVTDINPAAVVKDAMNAINAAQRQRVAATETGEAEKIIKVKAAEAEAESMALRGQGIANERKAIVEGFQESIERFHSGVPDASSSQIMALLMMSQYIEMLKSVGSHGHSNTLMVPHTPSGMMDISAQLQQALIAANQVQESTNAPN